MTTLARTLERRELLRYDPAAQWLPLAAGPAIALWAAAWMQPWMVMTSLAITVYLGCKWATWWPHRQAFAALPWWRGAGYILAWPGMDASPFLTPQTRTHDASDVQWTQALSKTLVGLALVWSVARLVPAQHELIIGWIGCAGMVLGLHFGLFHLLALAWQHAGLDTRPIMGNPLRSTSVSAFWSLQWNRSFHELARRFIFRPVARHTSGAVATLAVFVVSGLVHELVISVPAQAGFGGPTIYFALQGAAVIVERSRFGRSMQIGRGRRGWCFAAICTIGPLYWLFHPAFQTTVIVPLLHVMRAL